MPDSPYQSLAQTYDAIRPGYPEELIHDILAETQPATNRPLLELGAGTGKATTAFLNCGFSVDAVELDPDMAALLRARCPTSNLRLSVAAFKTWTPPEPRYALLYCAQAFHWLDPKIKYQKCHALLDEDGFLALFWYDPLSPAGSPAQTASEQVCNRYFGPAAPISAGPLESRKQEVLDSGLFALVLEKQYRVTIRNTAQQSLMAMQSTPAFAAQFSQLSPTAQQEFLREYTDAVQQYGGFLEVPMLYSLYLFRPL